MFFKGIKLFIPISSMKVNLIKENNCGGLAGHFRIDKTMSFLQYKYYWKEMYKDVNKFVRSCGIFQVAKGVSQNSGLYTPIFVKLKNLGLTSVWIFFLD